MADVCDWPIIVDDPVWTAATQPQRDAASRVARDVLWMLSGRVFGLCTVTVRPCHLCPDRTAGRSGHLGVSGGLMQGDYRMLLGSSCGCAGAVCAGSSEVALEGPVHDITEVRVDGTVLDEAAYRVRNRRWLMRVDGQRWPQAQNMDAADDEAGAFTVTYRRGIEVPYLGQVAAGLLALEWLKGMTGRDCGLPAGATSVSRQGVTVEVDPRGLYEAGVVGIPEVDQWLLTVNPNRLSTPAQVYSVDLPAPSRIR